MSVRIMTLVWDCALPSLSHKLVALKLADCANDDGENIYPSVARVERETGCSESVVREALALLEAAGFLHVVEERTGNRWNRSTVIRRFDVERLAMLSRGELVWTHEDVPVIDAKTGEQKVRPDGRPRVERLWTCAPPGIGAPPGTGGVPLRASAPTPPESGPHPSGQRPPYKEEPSLNRHSPVIASGRARDVDLWISFLLDGRPGRELVVRTLVEPIIRQRSFSAPDPAYALAEIVDGGLARGLDAERLASAARCVLDTRAATVKPSDIEAALREQATARQRAQQAAIKAKAAAADEVVVAKAGTPEFEAALRLYPAEADQIRARGFAKVSAAKLLAEASRSEPASLSASKEPTP